jgi:hypothetical protein
MPANSGFYGHQGIPRMKLRRFRRNAARPHTLEPRPAPVAPVPRRLAQDSPPRMWSLLLPPGFTDRR